jgi:hypothetical protein
MKEVVIIFLGLIVHMDLQNSNTAVLPRAPGHTPVLFIHQNGQKITEDLDGKYVAVYGAKGNFSRAGIADVPPLQEISACKHPIDAVEKLGESEFVAAYVDFLEGGSLVSALFHNKAVHFDHVLLGSSTWANRHCATCKIEYRAEPIDKTIFISIQDMKRQQLKLFEIKPGDLVIIQNATCKGCSSPDHFLHFYDLLTGCPPGARPIPKENPADPCTQLPTTCDQQNLLPAKYRYLLKEKKFRKIFISPTVECTNSQWP